MTEVELAELALANPVNRAILQRLPSLGLDDAWLTAGCLFQAVWNRRAGRAAGAEVKDYDLFYFDGADLSWDAEDRAIRRASDLFADLGVSIELKNQARVHLWYGEKFGPGYPALKHSRDGVDRFLVRCTCLAMRPASQGVEVYAPDGLADLAAGVLRQNPLNPNPELFAAKAASYRARWPWLTVMG